MKIGDRVRTIEDSRATDWSIGARSNVRWGVDGKVVHVHHGHGLCYDVRHDDGSKAPYNPEELKLVQDLTEQAKLVISDPRFTSDVRRLLVEWDEGLEADTTRVWSTCRELGLHELEPGEDHSCRHTELGVEVVRILTNEGTP